MLEEQEWYCVTPQSRPARAYKGKLEASAFAYLPLRNLELGAGSSLAARGLALTAASKEKIRVYDVPERFRSPTVAIVGVLTLSLSEYLRARQHGMEAAISSLEQGDLPSISAARICSAFYALTSHIVKGAERMTQDGLDLERDLLRSLTALITQRGYANPPPARRGGAGDDDDEYVDDDRPFRPTDEEEADDGSSLGPADKGPDSRGPAAATGGPLADARPSPAAPAPVVPTLDDNGLDLVDGVRAGFSDRATALRLKRMLEAMTKIEAEVDREVFGYTLSLGDAANPVVRDYAMKRQYFRGLLEEAGMPLCFNDSWVAFLKSLKRPAPADTWAADWIAAATPEGQTL